MSFFEISSVKLNNLMVERFFPFFLDCNLLLQYCKSHIAFQPYGFSGLSMPTYEKV